MPGWKDRQKERQHLGQAMAAAGCGGTQINLTLCAVAGDIPMEKLLMQWLEAVDSWCAHPDYEWWHHEGDIRYEEHPGKCLLLAVFEHEPGKEKITESYLLTHLDDLPPQLAWGEKSLGWFIGFRPFPHWMVLPSIPAVKERRGAIVNSLKGGGRAYMARMTLKRFLPRRCHKFIQHARRMKRHRLDRGKTDPITGRVIHDYSTKREKFIHLDGPVLGEGEWRQMCRLIDPGDFYDCATGKHHPDDVHLYVTHQPAFSFLDNVEEKA